MKTQDPLSPTPLSFIGLIITANKANNEYQVIQTEEIDRLETATNQKEFSSQRAFSQYIGVNIRPDVYAPVQLIAPGNTPTRSDDWKSLEKSIKFIKSTK